MNQSILDLREKMETALSTVSTIAELDSFRVEYLGKKGSITALLKNMGALSPEEKKSFGKEVNALKSYAEQATKDFSEVDQECAALIRNSF